MPEMDRNIPGPNSYAIQNMKRSASGITMGIRHSEFCSTGLPAHYSSNDDWWDKISRLLTDKLNWMREPIFVLFFLFFTILKILFSNIFFFIYYSPVNFYCELFLKMKDNIFIFLNTYMKTKSFEKERE